MENPGRMGTRSGNRRPTRGTLVVVLCLAAQQGSGRQSRALRDTRRNCARPHASHYRRHLTPRPIQAMNDESTPPIMRRPDGRIFPPTSHLSQDRHGRYVLRITVPDLENRAFVGKRVTLQLRTGNAALAQAKRDTVLEFAALAGLQTRNVCIIHDSEKEVSQLSSLKSQPPESNMTT